MKIQLFLVCCAAFVLGNGCASSNSGGTSDQSGSVSGTSYREFYYAEPEHRQYYWKEPWTAPSQPASPHYAPGPQGYYYVNPHKDYFGIGAANVWDWVSPRPEFLDYRF